MRSRTTALLCAALFAAVPLAACGDDDDGDENTGGGAAATSTVATPTLPDSTGATTPATTPGEDTPAAEGDIRKQVEQTVTSYIDAILNKKHDDACSVLTERALKELTKAANKPATQEGCTQALDAARKEAGDAPFEALDGAEVKNIRISSDQQRATVTYDVGEVSNEGALVREGDRWLIDSDPA